MRSDGPGLRRECRLQGMPDMRRQFLRAFLFRRGRIAIGGRVEAVRRFSSRNPWLPHVQGLFSHPCRQRRFSQYAIVSWSTPTIGLLVESPETVFTSLNVSCGNFIVTRRTTKDATEVRSGGIWRSMRQYRYSRLLAVLPEPADWHLTPFCRSDRAPYQPKKCPITALFDVLIHRCPQCIIMPFLICEFIDLGANVY